MRSMLKTTAVFLCAIFSCLSLTADELDDYVRQLDRAENGFWRAVLSTHMPTIVDHYNSILNDLCKSARMIYALQEKNGQKIKYTNLSRPGNWFRTLLDHQQNFKHVSANFNCKKTSLQAYCRQSCKNRSRTGSIGEENISIADYAQHLAEIKDHNLALIDSRLRTSNNNSVYKHRRNSNRLTLNQKNILLDTAKKFYTVLIEARLTVAKMRQSDPLFQRKCNSK